jgi:hypothetical protein
MEEYVRSAILLSYVEGVSMKNCPVPPPQPAPHRVMVAPARAYRKTEPFLKK